jgi:carbon-monoxide dehydrogenase medium subunit
MKPAPFDYRRPETLEEALGLLAEHGDAARALAGGQSLMPLLNMRQVRPAVVVDITRLPGLGGIGDDGPRLSVAALGGAGDDGTMLSVGALVTQFQLGELAGLDDALRECLPYTGHYATRHQGTIGGSIAYGEPRGELPLTLLALGGKAIARSLRGERGIPAHELYVGSYRTSLAADELIVATLWPRARAGEGHAFSELAQRHGDFTLGSAACSLAVSDGQIVEARVAVGAVAERPVLVPEAAQALIGAPATAATAQGAGQATAGAVAGYDDQFGSAAYRRHLAGVLVADVAARAMRRAGGGPGLDGGGPGLDGGRPGLDGGARP